MNFSNFTTWDSQQVLRELVTSTSGLSDEEVRKRQLTYGTNEISHQDITWWGILFRQLKSPFIYLLVFASLLALFLGEAIDAVMIAIFIAINTGLSFYQEYHSEKTLKLLSKYILPKTKVVRESNDVVINRSELVPGDLVVMSPGDIIPADIRLTEVQNLLIDESLLTGESISVGKASEGLRKRIKEIYQANNIVFSGTTVLSGSGKGVVFNTGKNTVLGEVASLTMETKHQSSFEKGIARFSSFILRLIVITLIFVVLLNIAIKGGETNFSTLLIFAIALAVSVIPEALPVVTTFSLSRGALLLAKSKVIVKRLSAIEDLGSIEVLCTDKTGTITENNLKVDNYFPADNKKVIMYACLAGTEFSNNKNLSKEPFNNALVDSLSVSDNKILAKYKKLKEVPFDPERRRNSVLVKSRGGYELIVRGAPEVLFKLCRNKSNLYSKFEQWYKSQGQTGNRVLAVAVKKLKTVNIDNLQNEEKQLEIVGLISFSDPLKKTAKPAIKKAELLGVKIKILTGDSREVAGSVACQVGLTESIKHVLTGDEFNQMTQEEQHEAVENYSVFARVTPDQKHKIVQLLRERYEVGFLGEGINDAPALKASNVAIVVDTASDISRDTADIVLLHKSLDIIVDGIMQGREIFANTAKYIKATLSSNFGNFYTVAIVSLFINFLPLLPIQILLINLLTDFPMIAVATDKVDPEELKRPKSYEVKEIVLVATFLGIVSTIFDFMFFFLFYRISPAVLQTNWFIGSVVTELLFLFSIRTRFFFLQSKPPSVILIFLTSIAFITAIVLPLSAIGQQLFSFVRPSTYHLYLILLIAVTYFVTTEIVKLLYYQYISSRER